MILLHCLQNYPLPNPQKIINASQFPEQIISSQDISHFKKKYLVKEKYNFEVLIFPGFVFKETKMLCIPLILVNVNDIMTITGHR